MAEIDYNALTHALSSRRFLPEVFDTAAEAKAAALRIIGSKSVGIGGSATVRDMGLAEALQANGNQVYWHWLAAKEAKQAARDKALTADVYMCSTNALTADGRLVNIDGTGNRAAGLIYGPHEVVVIVGKNKIVTGLDEAMDRIKRDACPQNARRQDRSVLRLPHHRPHVQRDLHPGGPHPPRESLPRADREGGPGAVNQWT